MCQDNYCECCVDSLVFLFLFLSICIRWFFFFLQESAKTKPAVGASASRKVHLSHLATFVALQIVFRTRVCLCFSLFVGIDMPKKRRPVVAECDPRLLVLQVQNGALVVVSDHLIRVSDV